MVSVRIWDLCLDLMSLGCRFRSRVSGFWFGFRGQCLKLKPADTKYRPERLGPN